MLFLLAFVVSGTVFCAISFSENNIPELSLDLKQDFTGDQLPQASDVSNESLDYSDIYQNTTIIRRVFESIKFEVNISEFWASEGNYTEIQFSFTNNTVLNITMTNATQGNFTYTYTPEYNAPIGFQNVTFLVFNGSQTSRDLLLNNQSSQVNFTIIANVMVGLNSSQYDRGEFLNADIVVNGISDWNVSITNGENGLETEFQDIGVNIYQFQHEIDAWFAQANSYYYVRVNVSYNSQWASIYFRFLVLNSPPIIVENTVDFTPGSVYRTSICRIDVNITDYENDSDPSYLNVSMLLEDPNGDIYIWDAGSDLLDNDKDGSFKHNFVVTADKPAGTYRVKLTATDQHGGTDYYETYLTVLNNPPVINSYTINDNPMNASISINYGEDLVFGFNVTDEEGIAYITVALLNEQNEWFNITRAYYGNMTITVRTFDLIRGNWIVYVYVTDTDGYTVGLDFDYGTAPQEIKIIEDLLSVVLPWVAFFIGIAIGIAAGMGAGYSLLKSRALKEQEPVKPKRTTPTKGKPISKRRAEKKPLAKKFRCRQCGALIDSEIDACPKCGEEIDLIKCKKCGSVLDLDKNTCQNCGDRVKPIKKTQDKTPTPQRKIKRKLK